LDESVFRNLLNSFGLLDNASLEKDTKRRCRKTNFLEEYKMSKLKWNSPPEMQIDTNKTYRVTMNTDKGLIELELYAQHAPKTVNNFVFLAKEGFYDGVSFHRVIPNFVIQGGDPTGTGSGGPGYQFEDEVKGNPLRHERGVISMANAGPNTNGSQFFITHSPQAHLNGKHTVFGKVVTGLDVVDEIRAGDTMQRVTILEE
jgi:peptidyl-prolyl cis-trans isomerase B (cyclophilin B)